MEFIHPALMTALYFLGLLVASRGGPARMVRLGGRSRPDIIRRHRLPAAIFAALILAGYGAGLLMTSLLLPLLLARSSHFVVGTALITLLALVVAAAWLAHRGVRWALHLHPLLATTFLLLYLVQALLGLHILGYAPLPPEHEHSGSTHLAWLAALKLGL